MQLPGFLWGCISTKISHADLTPKPVHAAGVFTMHFQEGVLTADWVSELQTLKGSPTGDSAPAHFLKEHDVKLLYRPHAISEPDFVTEKWK